MGDQAPEVAPQTGSAWTRLGTVMDLVTPMAVRVAATLRLADLIDDGGSDVRTLAARSGTDPDALARLMRHLVCHGVFSQVRPDVFAVNELAGLLREGDPSGMRSWLDLDGFGGRMDLAFTGLLHTVRTGGPAWQTVFGEPFWAHLDADPEMAGSFDAVMAAGPEYLTDAAGGYDWAGTGHLIDVGGGTGALLAEVLPGMLAARPNAHATLVDLPETVERAGRYLAERGLAGRCTLVGQSFFDPLPRGGEVYVLKRVLHDWGDEQAGAILRRCAAAAEPDGRVVIIESFGAAADDPAGFAEMDLRMLVLCGGHERTVQGYTELAAAAGLAVVSVRDTPLGHSAITCAPR